MIDWTRIRLEFTHSSSVRQFWTQLLWSDLQRCLCALQVQDSHLPKQIRCTYMTSIKSALLYGFNRRGTVLDVALFLYGVHWRHRRWCSVHFGPTSLLSVYLTFSQLKRKIKLLLIKPLINWGNCSVLLSSTMCIRKWCLLCSFSVYLS